MTDLITTPRLVLRPWRLEDAPVLRRALDEADAHLRPWIPFMRAEPRTLAQTAARVASFLPDHASGLLLRFAVWREEALIGEVLLMPDPAPTTRELGYWLHPAWVGQGYAFEASAAVRDLAFDALEVARLHLRCDPRNVPSNALAQRLGGVLEGLEQHGEGSWLNVWSLARAV